VRERWVSYMAAHDLDPALLGAATWGAVSPMGRADAGAGQGRPTSASPLALRRLFYWTMRFTHWDSVRCDPHTNTARYFTNTAKLPLDLTLGEND
jgi:hypothetical protein